MHYVDLGDRMLKSYSISKKTKHFILLVAISLLFVLFVASGEPAGESSCTDTAIESSV
jgi:hypothetical protein